MARNTTSSPVPCPVCNGTTRATDVRAMGHGLPGVRRRRACTDKHCDYRFTTLEILYGPHPRAKEVAQWAAEQNRDIFHHG